MALPRGKKKKTRQLDRKFDSKYLGDEPVWEKMPEPQRRRVVKMETYQWYNYFHTSKDHRKYVLQFAKERLGYSKQGIADLKAAPDWEMSIPVEKLIRMALKGWVLDEAEDLAVKTELRRVATKMSKVRKAEALRAKTEKPLPKISNVNSPILAELDDIEDRLIRGEKIDEGYKIFERQQIHNDTKGNLEKWVAPWLDTRIEELELHKKGDEDVKEGLGISAQRRNYILNLLSGIRSDLELMLVTKRKRIVKKKPSKLQEASKQAKGFKHLKESSEYKIKSIEPESIIGAKYLYMFNTKRRELHVLIANEGGFGGKGMAVTNFDPAQSYKMKLRKPDETIPEVLTKTHLRIKRLLDAESTKPSETNGRMNDATVLLRSNRA